MENEVAKALHDGLDRLRKIDADPDLFYFEAELSDAQETADGLLNAVAFEQYPDRMAGEIEPIVAANNHPDTTQAEVEGVFEKAIVRAYETL